MPFQPGFDEVILRSAEKQAWLYFKDPLRTLTAWNTVDVKQRLEEIERAVEEEGLHAVGFLAFEAAPAFDHAFRVRQSAETDFPLLWFGIYQEPEQVAELEVPGTAVVTGADWRAEVNKSDYRRAIRGIKQAIAGGETYQVNYTYRLRAAWYESAWSLFSILAGSSPAPYAAYIESNTWTVCSFSPELFFSLDGEVLTSRPMKGTARRGLQLEDDLRQAAWLQRSSKNRAENIMIVDMVRNDFGRIGKIGSVNVPALYQIEKYPTVWQMTSTVQARTEACLSDIFRALFPAASITGAPKIRTMQIITELETSPRRIYTGTIGYYAPGRKACFNVAIRTLLVDKNKQHAEFGIGGGIVWDSRPELEWEESRMKARVLFEAPQAFDLLETILWTPLDGWLLLPEHIERLKRSAAYFSYSINIAELQEKLAKKEMFFDRQSQRVRVLVSRSGKLDLSHAPIALGQNPLKVGLARTPVDSADRFLYHKSTLRTVYERARTETAGFDEALLRNERGELTEACIANLVVELDGELVTPPVRCGLLPGVYRGWLRKQSKISERVLYPADLRLCSRIFLANSLRGLWEIQVFGLE